VTTRLAVRGRSRSASRSLAIASSFAFASTSAVMSRVNLGDLDIAGIRAVGVRTWIRRVRFDIEAVWVAVMVDVVHERHPVLASAACASSSRTDEMMTSSSREFSTTNWSGVKAQVKAQSNVTCSRERARCRERSRDGPIHTERPERVAADRMPDEWQDC
jgi:hypothetical protein